MHFTGDDSDALINFNYQKQHISATDLDVIIKELKQLIMFKY